MRKVAGRKRGKVLLALNLGRGAGRAAILPASLNIRGRRRKTHDYIDGGGLKIVERREGGTAPHQLETSSTGTIRRGSIAQIDVDSVGWTGQ